MKHYKTIQHLQINKTKFHSLGWKTKIEEQFFRYHKTLSLLLAFPENQYQNINFIINIKHDYALLYKIT